MGTVETAVMVRELAGGPTYEGVCLSDARLEQVGQAGHLAQTRIPVRVEDLGPPIVVAVDHDRDAREVQNERQRESLDANAQGPRPEEYEQL